MLPLCRLLRGYPGLSISLEDLANLPNSLVDAMLTILDSLEANESLERIRDFSLGSGFVGKSKEVDALRQDIANRANTISYLYKYGKTYERYIQTFEEELPMNLGSLMS